MNVIRLSLVVMLAGLVAATARADDSKVAAKPEAITVPFEVLQKGRMISGHFAVQVKINGKGPYRLIFDTGAPTMLISQRVAKEANLLRQKGMPKLGAFGMPGQVRIGKVEIGGATAKDLPAVAIDHPTVMAIAEVFGPVDGIVGFPFFARFSTSVDYQAKQLTFVPNGYVPGDVMQAMMDTIMKQPKRKGPPQPRVMAPAAQWGLRVAKDDGDEDSGVVIREVFPGGAASNAGIQVGDRMLLLDGRWTDTVADCYLAAESIKSGQTVEAVLKRGDKEVRLQVKPTAGL